MEPLFPLRTVLFPGGILPLRIFEQRYVTMAKSCLQDGTGFGVCLITKGEEVAPPGRPVAGAAPEFAKIGTMAKIREWDVPQLGIFHVKVEGVHRFKVIRHSVQDNGLVVGDLTPLPPEPQRSVAPTFAPVRKFLEMLAARVGPEHFPAVNEFDDASWLGYRLAELLPLPLNVKQSMLEINDSEVRLAVLARFLREQQLI